MDKNITVLDMQGKVCGATYPRRAKGLVKKGRARFAGERTICLVCPPHQSEEDRMDQIQTGSTAAEETLESIEKAAQLDAAYLVEEIDRIVNNTDYLTAALRELQHLEGEAAVAAGNMIEARERTNQRMIDMLEKLMGKLSI